MNLRTLKIAAFMLFCTLLLASAHGQQAATATPKASSAAIDTSTWKTYHNSAYGFEVRYPADWRVSEAKTAASGQGAGPTMIDIRKPRGNGGDAVYLTLAIQPDQNPQRLPIDNFFAQQLQRLHAKPEATGRTTVGGQPAVWMENSNSFGTRHDVFLLLHGSELLSFGYTRNAAFDPVFAEIIASFHLLK